MAFWFMCLWDSGAATRSVVAIVCGAILILTVWCIWTSWEKQPPSDAASPDELLSFEKDTTQKTKGFKFERNESLPQNPRWRSTTFPLKKWVSWEKQPPSDVETPKDNLSVEGDCAERKIKGEGETTRSRIRRFRTSSWATSFGSFSRKSRSETGMTMVEQSVNDEKGKSSP